MKNREEIGRHKDEERESKREDQGERSRRGKKKEEKGVKCEFENWRGEKE